MTSRPDVPQLVISALSAACNANGVRLAADTNLLEFGMDSTSLLIFVAQIESVLGKDLPPEEILAISQGPFVSDVIERVEAWARTVSATGVNHP